MFELNDYKQDNLQSYDELRKQLQKVKLRKLEFDSTKQLTVWEFLNSGETGAAFELEFIEPISLK